MSAKANKARCQLWAEEQIAKAEYFTAVMFLGYPAGRDRREAPTLEGARALRQTMLEEYSDLNYGRKVVIYAVTRDNVTVMVE